MKSWINIVLLSLLSYLILNLLRAYIFPLVLPATLTNVLLGKSPSKLTKTDCAQFFHGKPWPRLKDYNSSESVKLCQTTTDEDRVYFASLYNIRTKIPIYSANAVILSDKSDDLPRPGTKYWNRISLALCAMDTVPVESISSDIGHPDHPRECGGNQAEAKDYKHNNMHLDRGHLSPNSINAYNEGKQIGTFTLTNAAPQFAGFNEYSWRVYECVTKQTIIDLAPNETTYIITGTLGAAKDEDGDPLWINEDYDPTSSKSPVLVPGYYWKAVCYPGNAAAGKAPWAYAIIQENVNVKKHTSPDNYMKVQEFSSKYFEDDIFGPECMSADFGDFASVFSKWDDYTTENCPAPF